MNTTSYANYDGFSLVNGGLIYAATSVFRGKSDSRAGRIRTSIALVIITWVPLLLITLFEGTLNDNGTTISFVEDFMVHVRLLLVVPFLILVEHVVDRSFVGYIKTTDEIIPESQQPEFNKLVNRLNKLTNSYVPETLMLIVVFATIFMYWNDLSIIDSGRNYLASADGNKLQVAGWYYLLVCSPIFILLTFRWLWRWILWTYSLIKISKFKLEIDPFHADQMAGLEYLNLSPLTFSFILMAPSAILSSIIGVDIIYENADLTTYAFQIIVYIVLFPLILYAPLLVFIPKLIEAKSYGILNFGSLIREHNRAYDKKWIEQRDDCKDELLGNMDNSSLADINGSYAPIQGIKLFPINFQMLVLSFVLNVIPYIPLIFTYYSATDLIKDLINHVIGG